VGHFDGHVSALEQYRRHLPMRHVQGYPGSHWTLPSGNYSLCIAPATAGATAKKTTIKKCTNFSGHFDGRGGVPVQYRMHRLMEEIQGYVGYHTGCRRWASIVANSSHWTYQCRFF
jgi:hypothetical protein